MCFTIIMKKTSFSVVSSQHRLLLKKKKRVPFSANLAHKNKDQLWVHERSFCFKAEFPAVLLSKAIPLKTQ